MAKITARELAQRLQLSPAAVSLALNGKPGVSEATRARVLDEARALGCQPPKTHNSRAYTVCVAYFIDPQVNFLAPSSFVANALRGITAAARSLNCTTQVRYIYADRPMDAQAARILAEASAVLLMGTDIVERTLPQARSLVAALSAAPVVVVDNTLLADRVDCVYSDNFTGARSSVEHLLAQGCRTFGYLRAVPRIESNLIRERGFRSALAERGLTFDPVVDMQPFSEDAYAAFLAWLKATPTLPDAFIADHDVLAITAIRALNKQGIAIPQQVALIGFDDIPASKLIVPPLSTIRTCNHALGYTALGCLMQRLRTHWTPLNAPTDGLLRVTLSTSLQARQSTTGVE